tara:strand:- start:132 stop:419 length:288 start_codon:yes stop_codon:yes gene_type:complete
MSDDKQPQMFIQCIETGKVYNIDHIMSYDCIGRTKEHEDDLLHLVFDIQLTNGQNDQITLTTGVNFEDLEKIAFEDLLAENDVLVDILGADEEID